MGKSLVIHFLASTLFFLIPSTLPSSAPTTVHQKNTLPSKKNKKRGVSYLTPLLLDIEYLEHLTHGELETATQVFIITALIKRDTVSEAKVTHWRTPTKL